MSIFGTLASKIFGHADEAKAAAPAAAAPAPAAPAAAPTATSAATGEPVDVDATLAYLAQQSGQPSNYKTSIVDLMKLVGMDSSLTARKELAGELGYTGDTDDSATMNIWLHQKVMEKLATAKA